MAMAMAKPNAPMMKMFYSVWRFIFPNMALLMMICGLGYGITICGIDQWMLFQKLLLSSIITIGRISLVGSFPIPVQYNYSYHNTWGDARGWGGRRIHEGTDIFADYGTPVRATRFGVIEVMGWNMYGGWRVGIRDLENVYHYYAHLSSFNKKFKIGDIVEPGNVIGYVGSSGYGKPGTSGKFPPHLHYGMYRDNGKTEWSFDPYPYLKRWEREEYQKKSEEKIGDTLSYTIEKFGLGLNPLMRKH